MFIETVKISIYCDTPRCFRLDNVERDTKEEANKILYDLGWRVVGRTGKHLCPKHVIALRDFGR